MSQAVALQTDNSWVASPPWDIYSTLSSIISPAPVGLWVLCDENPDSINDAALAVDMSRNKGSAAFQDGPAALHSGGCSLGFADGHGEVHKWTDGRWLARDATHFTSDYDYGFTIPNCLDVAWFEFRTSANQNGTPGW